MRRIAKSLIAGVVAVSMCVSPVGVMAGEEPVEELFVAEEAAVEEAGYYSEETVVYDGGEEVDSDEIGFDEEVTTEGEEDLAFDEPSFVEEDQFVEEDLVIDETADAVPDEAIVDETITEGEVDTVIEETITSDEISLAEMSGSCGVNATWTLSGTGSDLTLTISGTGGIDSFTESTIPWVASRAMIKTVVIEPGITDVGDYAFYKLINLSSVSLPEGLLSIRDYAFEDDTKIKSIVIPESVVYLGKYVFSGCTGITEILVPDNVTRLGSNAFQGCSNLVSVSLSDNISYIGGDTFGECTKLEQVKLPKNLNQIDNATSTMILENGMYYRGAFYSCTSLENISLPENLTTIGNGAFCSCTKLASVTIPEKVKNIGAGAFAYCSSLPSINIPNSVSVIGNNAFSGCSSLKNMVIPEGVSEIAGRLFSDCSCLKTVSIPESATTIGYYAFHNCASLEAITIPSNITRIEDAAFSCCQSLESIVIPDSVTYLGGKAFAECGNLTSINLPDGIDVLQSATFIKCEKLESIKLPRNLVEIQDRVGLYGNGSQYLPDGVFAYCSSLKTIELPEGLKKLGNYVFYECPSLSRMKIPGGVTGIGECSFYDCISLSSIELPDGIISIGANAFYNCISLKNIQIPDGVTSIEYQTFYNCTSLSSIKIPDFVANIGYRAFYNCTSLKSIVLPDGLTSIEDQVFQDCISLEIINIPSAITKFGDSNNRNASPIDNTPSLYNIIIPGLLSCNEAYLGNMFFDEDGNTYEYLPATLTKRTVLTRVIEITKIELSENKYTLKIGESVTLKPGIFPENATQRELIFSSNNPNVAIVNEDGKVTGVGSGNTTIYIRSKDQYYIYAVCEVNVDNTRAIHICEDEKIITSKTLGLNQTTKFSAIVQSDFITEKSVTWSSSDETVATVSSEGVVTAKAPGTTEIIATSVENKSYKASVSLNVVTVKEIKIKEGDSYITSKSTGIKKEIQLSADVLPEEVTDKTVTWSSSDDKVATVDQNGKVTTVGGGTAVITATSNENKLVSGSVNLEVITVQSVRIKDGSTYPISKDMTKGATATLTAVVTPTNVTDRSVEWSSDDTSVATVDQNGKVTAVAKGTTYIHTVSKENPEAHASIKIVVTESGETSLEFISAVDAIPDNVTVADKTKIENARAEYMKLTTEQKELSEVKTALEKLMAAEKALKNAEDQAAAVAVKKFTNAVNAIKSAKSGEGKKKLTAATNIYDTLTDDQKALVSEETMSTYNNAINAYKEGIVFRSGDAYYKVLPSGNVTYNKPVDKKKITGCAVPAQVKKYGFLYKVVKVSINAYKDCPNLEWVVVHKNISHIGKYAFKNTPKLKTIKIMTTSLKTGSVTNAFTAGGAKKGAGLTVKVPNGYVKTYGNLFKGEGGLNSKAKVQAVNGVVEVSFGDGLGGDLEIPMEESVEVQEALHILKNRD